MRRLVPLVLVGFFAVAALAQSQAEIVKEMARIQSESAATHPVGAWVKAKDGKGRELTITVTDKKQGKDGWQLTSSIVTSASTGKAGPPVKTTSVQGSIPNLSKPGPLAPVSMATETLTIAGNAVPCKVFTMKNGQKIWMAPEVPGGGHAKVVGPKGEAFMTATSYGDK